MIESIIGWVDEFELILAIPFVVLNRVIFDKFRFLALFFAKQVYLVDVVLKKLLFLVLMRLCTDYERRIDSFRL